MRVEANHRLAVFVISLLSFIPAVDADTLTYGVDLGVAETDNVTLVGNDKVSQTMAVADADVDYKHQSLRLDADAKGNFTYLDYLQNAYHSQLLGRFDGTGTFALIPERLTWTLQENYGQQALDPFTPTTPTNIESVNYVSTGPNLALRFGGLSFVDLNARVARADYETSPFTNNRISGSIAWGRQLSARSTVSLNGDIARVLFQNTVSNTDFDRTNAFAQYALQGDRTQVTADLGATKVNESGESTNGGLARLMLSRKLSPAAKLTLTLGHYLTDGSTNFSGLQSGAIGVVSTAQAASTSSNYTSNNVSLEWRYTRSRTTLALSGRWEKDTYAGQAALDHKETGAEVRLQRQLTRGFSAQILGRYSQSDYENAVVAPGDGSPKNNTGTVSAGVVWHHGRGLEMKLQCEHTSYSTSADVGAYKENRILLTIGYRPYAPRTSYDDIPNT